MARQRGVHPSTRLLGESSQSTRGCATVCQSAALRSPTTLPPLTMAAATAAFVTGTGNMQRTRLVMTQPWRSGLIAYVRLWVREGARVSLQLWGRRRCTPPARPARPKWQSCCGRVKMKGTL